MAITKEISYALNLGIFKLEGKLAEDDRQCAWELYTEIATRVAVVGKRKDPGATDFDGELYHESLDSLYNFFREARGIMRRFPVGRIKDFRQQHLGVFINAILADVLRPFLEKWKGDYAAWYSKASQQDVSPYEVQKLYPRLTKFLAAWSNLRLIMRQVERTLANEYKLVPLQ